MRNDAILASVNMINCVINFIDQKGLIIYKIRFTDVQVLHRELTI